MALPTESRFDLEDASNEGATRLRVAPFLLWIGGVVSFRRLGDMGDANSAREIDDSIFGASLIWTAFTVLL
jgi:hypothetical protein